MRISLLLGRILYSFKQDPPGMVAKGCTLKSIMSISVTSSSSLLVGSSSSLPFSCMGYAHSKMATISSPSPLPGCNMHTHPNFCFGYAHVTVTSHTSCHTSQCQLSHLLVMSHVNVTVTTKPFVSHVTLHSVIHLFVSHVTASTYPFVDASICSGCPD